MCEASKTPSYIKQTWNKPLKQPPDHRRVLHRLMQFFHGSSTFQPPGRPPMGHFVPLSFGRHFAREPAKIHRGWWISKPPGVACNKQPLTTRTWQQKFSTFRTMQVTRGGQNKKGGGGNLTFCIINRNMVAVNGGRVRFRTGCCWTNRI